MAEAEALPLAGGRGPVATATAVELKLALKEKFGGKGYHIFFEVGDDTGMRVRRHADAVSIGIWPSTGHAIHGFEIKVSRGDWLRELADPEKAQSIFRFCHRWSLVTPAGLVSPDELPPGWGHYAYRDGRLREAVMPKRMEPEPPTSGFMAAVVRRAGEQDSALLAEVHRKVREEEEAKREAELGKRVERALRDRDHRRDEAVKTMADLEAALGEPLRNIWDLKGLAAAIRLVRRVGLHQTYGGIGGVLQSLDQARTLVAQALDEGGLNEPGGEAT